MNERCGCGAAIEDVNDMEHIREFRREHRHDPPRPQYGPDGGFANTERGPVTTGFAVPEHTDGMHA